MKSIKPILQLNSSDCGQTCIRIIANYFGKNYDLSFLKEKSGYTKSGTSFFSLCHLAEELHLKARAVRISFDALKSITQPTILHWKGNHYVVLEKISNSDRIKVIDPAVGRLVYSKDEFLEGWAISEEFNGHAILIETTPKFYETQVLENDRKVKLAFYFQYLRNCKKQIYTILTSFVFALFVQGVTPFIMKSTVDIGIEGRDFNFIILITIAQIVLTISSTIVGFINTRISTRMSNILNISILSDFWKKLTLLPISYFDKYHTGDTLKRLGDHSVIQSFITNTSLNLVTSIVTFCLYTVILLSFNYTLFIIFIIGHAFYLLWIWAFMGIRRKLNYQSFEIGSRNQNNIIQFIEGMQDIKLNNAELSKRWQWEKLQIDTFNFVFKTIDYNQIQSSGALLITHIKNITISLLVAKQVIDGEISFGTMISVQFIIGQLSGPLSAFLGFVQQTQDTKISLERLNDIHTIKEEYNFSPITIENQLIRTDGHIKIKDLHFKYPGQDKCVLKNISLEIPLRKTTAIIGSSGCGKSTLLKILMRSYSEYEGEIYLEDIPFHKISPMLWRDYSGFVTHNGFIFNETILNNIALGDIDPNIERAMDCCKIANIHDFVMDQPKGIHSTIGTEGIGLSQGQRQRILIARSLYKDPQFLFLDEPTNSLDSKNENEIIQNIKTYSYNKTTIIISHRLSTIKNADLIIVLDDGEIMESGTHNELLQKKAKYWHLIKEQLEVSNEEKVSS